MRCDGKPVRPGTGTTHRMSKASEPDKQNGTLFADSIRASSPNRLRQQAGQKTAPDQSQHIYLPLATREPSTEDGADRLGGHGTWRDLLCRPPASIGDINQRFQGLAEEEISYTGLRERCDVMANRSDREQDNPPNVQGVRA